MARYNYTEGIITSYAVGPDGVIITVSLTDSKGKLTQKYTIDRMSFIRINADKGTRVRLRENLDIPYILRPWEFVAFLP